MASFSQLPSGKWRVQVRRGALYRAATFATKREAKDWSTQIEAQANHIAAGGYAPVPKGATLADLIDKYCETAAKLPGKTKEATLSMLKRELGKVKLASLNAVVLRDFIDRRREDGAGGVTIAADLSFLSAVLKWGKHARQLDIPERLALDARASLAHHGLSTRSQERSREPTDDELSRIYGHWAGKTRQKIPMQTVCQFALATGMRQGEITRLEIEDIDQQARTVVIRDRKDPRNKKGNDQTVPLLHDAWAIVEPLITERESGLLFPFDERSISASFTRATRALGIEDLHFHDLRHKATAQFFRMGLDIPRVALLTGHKTWTMLRRYTAIRASDVHDAIKKPGALHRKKQGNKSATGKPENDPTA